MVLSRHRIASVRSTTGCGPRVVAAPLRRATRLAIGLLLLWGAAPVVVPRAQVAAAPLAAPAFPGPARGTPSTQAPMPTDFTLHGTVSVSDAARQAGGTAVVAGAALVFQRQGQAVLYLDVPSGSGSAFTASFGIPTTESATGPGTMRVRAIGRDGFILRGADVTATRGTSLRAITLSVAGAVAVVLDYLDTPADYPSRALLFNVHLSGGARALQPASAPGSAPVAGAAPLDLAGATHNGLAALATEAVSVTLVGLAQGKTAVASYGGVLKLALPPGASGTLVLRYGATDRSAGGVRTPLSVAVLDADGYLLRRAVGVAFAGGGLRPLWISLSGGRTVTFVAGDAADISIALTAVGILPGRLTPTYSNPDRVLYGGAPGGVAIERSAFISHCGGGYSDEDVRVARTLIMGHTVVTSRSSCGSLRLVLSVAGAATFHAVFAAPDNASGSAQPALTVVATAGDNAPLFQRTYRTAFGSPGVPLDVNLHYSAGGAAKNVSTLTFLFTTSTDSVLYGMRLTGNATAYSQVFPPVEPPVLGSGMAINPRAFSETDACALTSGDLLLLHEAALQEWALGLTLNCGTATLTLADLPFAHHTFTTRMGIRAGENPDTLVKIRLDVLDAAGHSVRHVTVPVRYGYGPLNAAVDLTGGARLRLSYQGATQAMVVVYAMTAS